jgi:flagellar basal body rod protein FlgG
MAHPLLKVGAMNVSLFHAAAALNANTRWQELIAQNIAASSVPGFKKQELSFESFQAGLMSAPASAPSFTMPRAEAATNFRQGDLKTTGVKTDVALEGPGFLAVEMPAGNTVYTRDGEFHLNASGQLVTKQGYTVLGESGPIQLDLNNPKPMSISSGGEVSQGADVKGKLRVTDFNDPSLLQPSGNGYFLATHPNLRPQDAIGTTLRQGFLEGANTSSAAEMVNLISAMRLYEANQRVIQMHDDRMGKTIAELGNPG